MSTEATARLPGGSGAAPAPDGAPGPPEERGHTRISDRVVERVAASAAAEVRDTGGAARRLLGVPRGGEEPEVHAKIIGQVAIVRVAVSVVYPAPVRQVARRVRESVAGRVRELTGLDARQVDVVVRRLVHPEEEQRHVR
ncbi:Asp23/Gls24 family envelope stress response protein [Sphaerisporangium sp. TRM90804]|uniref:Asp23/Gls24 family envelope stress response protein n=1 Tax=Sphaerisporangium sp. TRM90804 TaxID=3031113 RepID=UPI002446FB54|nr:Asp23/Gls24 family envelope stress response protein [Sphaerisporangium sp. TRM90804]MDH2424413.1 Asp23/Gls24 family envelope stress response protein [Sphaerisporangium sp. TRM90804]